jgi:hypothetical protein
MFVKDAACTPDTRKCQLEENAKLEKAVEGVGREASNFMNSWREARRRAEIESTTAFRDSLRL